MFKKIPLAVLLTGMVASVVFVAGVALPTLISSRDTFSVVVGIGTIVFVTILGGLIAYEKIKMLMSKEKETEQ